MSYQRWLTCIIVAGGAILLGGEYLLVRWYPGHEQRVTEAALRQLPYQNEGLGIQMEVAAGIYGKVRDYAGGIEIYRPKLFSGSPSITIASEPNPTSASQFSPQTIAQLETEGVRSGISGYEFEHFIINQRDAVIIWQFNPRQQSMEVTARILTPERIVRAVCDTGTSHQDVYTQACDASLRSIKLSGPPSQITQTDIPVR